MRYRREIEVALAPDSVFAYLSDLANAAEWDPGIVEARQLIPFEGSSLFGSPRWMWRRAVTKEAVYRWRSLTQPARKWVPAMMEASVAWGILKGAGRR